MTSWPSHSSLLFARGWTTRAIKLYTPLRGFRAGRLWPQVTFLQTPQRPGGWLAFTDIVTVRPNAPARYDPRPPLRSADVSHQRGFLRCIDTLGSQGDTQKDKNQGRYSIHMENPVQEILHISSTFF